MKKIAVLIDFSTASKTGVNHAITLAKASNAGITFVHFCHLPSYTGSLGIYFNEREVVNELLEKMKKFTEELLKKRKVSGIETNYIVKTGISFVDTINQAIKAAKPDLIVMGKSNTSSLERALFGNHLSHLYDKINVPLLAVPEKFPHKRYEKVVLCSDLSSLKKSTSLSVLADIVSTNKSKLFALNVAPYIKENEDTVIKKHLARISQLFNGTPITIDVTERLDFVTGLKEYGHANHVSLVAVFPHSHNILEKIFSPNHAKNVALHYDRPMLFIKN